MSVVDADGHVLEPADTWLKYLDPQYRDRAIRIVQADARGAPPYHARFDVVLLDAPCSGLGTIRRDPDIRWRRSESDLPALASAQREG